MRKTNKKSASCHPDKPHAARGLCTNCYAKWLRENSINHAEQQAKNSKSWHEKHPEYARQHKKQEIVKKGGPTYQRKLDLKKKYGITPETYDEMFKSQKGCCAICGKAQESHRRLSIDHCHETNNVRGLLCLSCNCGLGYFKDSIAHLKTAIRYLEQK